MKAEISESSMNRTSTRGLILSAVLAATSLTAAAGSEKVDLSKLPPAANKPGVTYASDIRPILEKTCFRCHGPEKHKGHLRLDSREAALKGGEDGKVIVPGQSAKSLLVNNVARIGDEDNWMPPVDKGDPLTKAQIGLIRAWIDQGSK